MKEAANEQGHIYISRGNWMSELPALPDTDSCQKMKDLVKGLAEALVDRPESVSVEVVVESSSTVLRLRVAPEDIGKVIGKQGRTARSIRTILSAASMKLQYRFSLDILEVGEAPRQSAAPAALATGRAS